MNKKALLEIKTHEAPKTEIPVNYAITSSIEQVEGKQILYLSFFWQSKEKKYKDKANFKIYIWDKGYISQKLQDDGSYKWSTACIDNLIGWWNYWYSGIDGLKARCYSIQDKLNIWDYFKMELTGNMKNWDELKIIDDFQKKLIQSKLDAKHARMKNAIDEVMSKVPLLPKEFGKWIYNGPFGFSRYIYYKRRGKEINAFCTECKEEFIIHETKQTKKTIKHNNTSICPMCRKKVTFKAVGKTTTLVDSTKFAIMQKYEDGFIIRYFWGTKEYKKNYMQPELTYGEDIREIYSFEHGYLQCKRFEHANFCNTNEYRWCKDAGKIETPKPYFYTRNLKAILKGTRWQYSCLYEYAKEVKFLYADSYLKEYLKHPGIEYLVKFKLFKFVDNHLSRFYNPDWYGVNFKGKTIKEVLGIEKPLFLQMQRLNLGTRGFEFIKQAAEKGKTLTDYEVRWALKYTSTNIFVSMLDYATPHKIIKYIISQSDSKHTPNNILSDWQDYINQCKTLKFDITNTFVLYPKDLRSKHDEYTILCKAKGLEKYDKKVRKEYKKLNNAYYYQDKNYLIRPASCVDEIVREGHALRHCVAGEHYINKIAAGEIAIMLIRKIEEPDQPFYTLELNLKQLEQVQCRGYQNCSMTEEIIKFTEKWQKKKLTQINVRKVV